MSQYHENNHQNDDHLVWLTAALGGLSILTLVAAAYFGPTTDEVIEANKARRDTIASCNEAAKAEPDLKTYEAKFDQCFEAVYPPPRGPLR